MASQQVENSMEKQDVVHHVNARRTIFPADSRNDVRPQPHPANQGIASIDEKLRNAWGIIETIHNDVYYYHNAVADKLATYERVIIEEKQKRQECAQAYNALHTQYGSAVNDLDDMVKRNLSLHQELEGAQETIRTLRECDRHLCTKNDHGTDQADWDMVEQGIAREQLEARIRELEEENANAMQEHQSALINAADRIVAAERKIEELEKTHHEQELQVWALTASLEQIPSPSIGKRQRPREDEHSVSPQQQGGVKKNRKCGRVAKRE